MKAKKAAGRFINRFDRYKNDLALHVVTKCGQSLFFHQSEKVLVHQGFCGFGHGFSEEPVIYWDWEDCCDDDDSPSPQSALVCGSRFKLGWSFEVLYQKTFVYRVEPTFQNCGRDWWRPNQLRRSPELLVCESSRILANWFKRGTALETTLRQKPSAPDQENREDLFFFREQLRNEVRNQQEAKRKLKSTMVKKGTYRAIEL